MDCLMALKAQNTTTPSENPQIRLATFMSRSFTLGLTYHGGTRNPSFLGVVECLLITGMVLGNLITKEGSSVLLVWVMQSRELDRATVLDTSPDRMGSCLQRDGMFRRICCWQRRIDYVCVDGSGSGSGFARQ
jgi:hypothetical protein